MVEGNYDYGSGARGLRQIIRQLGRVPDAIICGNDVMAIACVDTARHELGLEVPSSSPSSASTASSLRHG